MEKEIRIAQIIGKMNAGGVESFIMTYYRNIDRNKVQFDFIIDSDSTIVPRKEIESMGGRIIEISPYQKIFKYIKELRNVLKENQYTIVHSHLNALNVFPLYCAYKEKVPVRISHSHSTSNKKEWKKNLLKNVLKIFSKVFATHYFSCSEHAGRWLFGEKKLKNREITVIKNAINIEKFRYNENIRNKLRKELEVEDKIVFGHVGRFMKQKNHEFLIDVFKEVYQENNNTVLILIGNGPLEEKIKNKVKEIGIEKSVKFLGVKDNVNEYMQAMDMFLFPSLYEGLGIVAIEAQCSGLKCLVSTDVPKEVEITDNIKFIDNNKEIWKENIIKVMKEINDRYIELEKVNSKGYNIEKSAKELEKIYLDMV